VFSALTIPTWPAQSNRLIVQILKYFKPQKRVASDCDDFVRLCTESVTKIESHPSDVDDVDADSEYNDQFAAGDRQVAYQAEGFHFEDDLHDDSASDAIDQEDEDYDGDEDDSHPVLSALNELDMMCIHHNVSEAGFGDVDLRDLWLAFEDDSMQSDGLTREQLRRCHLKLMNYHQNPRFLSAFLNKLYALLDRSRFVSLFYYLYLPFPMCDLRYLFLLFSALAWLISLNYCAHWRCCATAPRSRNFDSFSNCWISTRTA
jgi:hypothetical protein